MTIWFTSDTHAGHPLVAVMRGFISDYYMKYDFDRIKAEQGIEAAREHIKKTASRKHYAMADIADVRAHDACIIDNINSLVNEDDELFMLGDIAFRATPEYVLSYLDGIHCKHKHMIIGNHDYNYYDRADDDIYENRFETIDNNRRIKLIINDRQSDVNLSHFPYVEQLTDPGGNDRSRFADAALHDDGRFLLYGHTHSSFKHNANSHCLHVGLDAWELKPVSEKQVDEWFSAPVNDRAE